MAGRTNNPQAAAETARKAKWSKLVYDYQFRMLDGATINVTSALRDAIQWEKNHGGTSFVAQTPSLTDLVWLGWAAAKRAGLTTLDSEGFMDQIEDYSMSDPEWVAEGPTLPDQPQS